MSKIMVVDDAAFMRMMLIDILTSIGHDVIGEAANGEEAISMYKKYKPDLVTMDLTMPEMDGITALRHIRSADPKAKVIICTAMGQQGLVLDAITAGAVDFLVKPIQRDRVVVAIERALMQ